MCAISTCTRPSVSPTEEEAQALVRFLPLISCGPELQHCHSVLFDLSCNVFLFLLSMLYVLLSCLVLSCLALSCLVSSCLVLYCSLSPCLIRFNSPSRHLIIPHHLLAIQIMNIQEVSVSPNTWPPIYPATLWYVHMPYSATSYTAPHQHLPYFHSIIMHFSNELPTPLRPFTLLSSLSLSLSHHSFSPLHPLFFSSHPLTSFILHSPATLTILSWHAEAKALTQ